MPNALRIVGLEESLAERIRTSLQDDFGNTLSPQIDDGTGPCRVCLDVARPGERLILFSYKPFAESSLYQEIGPVFIHADRCTSYQNLSQIPPYFNTRPLVVRPYTSRHHIHSAQKWADTGQLQSVAAEVLDNPDVAYVHVRSHTRGCYMFRVERADTARQRC